MQARPLKGSRCREARYDEREKRLEITFRDGSARAWKGVPRVVFDKLLAAPNPAAFLEDRIADEYPDTPVAAASTGTARGALDDLFGGKPDGPE